MTTSRLFRRCPSAAPMPTMTPQPDADRMSRRIGSEGPPLGPVQRRPKDGCAAPLFALGVALNFGFARKVNHG
jgi:hypothetical protein